MTETGPVTEPGGVTETDGVTEVGNGAYEDGAAEHSPLDAFLGSSPRRAKRHIFSILMLILIVLAAGVFLLKFLVGTDSAYFSSPVERGDLTPLVSERGTLQGSGEVTVRAPFDGNVLETPALGHTQVKAGDVLAVLDAEPIRNDIAIASAELAAAQGDLASAQAAVDQTGARLARFESVWRKSQGRVPAFNELETARTQATQALDARESATARAKAATLQLASDKARLAGAVIRAPTDGVLMTSAARVGQHIAAQDTLFTLATGTDRLHVDLQLPQTPTGPLQAGALAHVRIDDAPDKVQEARLDRILINPPGEPEKRIAQFVIDKPQPPLRAGLPVNAEIQLPVRSNVLLVPNSALHFVPAGSADPRRPRVYVLTRGEPRRVYVTVGGNDGAHTEVFSTDLKPGDRVITGWRDSSAGREP
ncbi:efflux RND transporter periplasmic adaptor subunit [Novosphingobium sp. 9]|uniref:efflux RND transporter periplasmic adaptor subunit n=1 Tax=Novosphingobium sp. 9 TaxID=2025349 RepID=UPI0021B64F6E|nr:efflux RND transporter periplasmic adaptor subunit [Novosphingobium sp. 9]